MGGFSWNLMLCILIKLDTFQVWLNSDNNKTLWSYTYIYVLVRSLMLLWLLLIFWLQSLSIFWPLSLLPWLPSLTCLLVFQFLRCSPGHRVQRHPFVAPEFFPSVKVFHLVSYCVHCPCYSLSRIWPIWQRCFSQPCYRHYAHCVKCSSRVSILLSSGTPSVQKSDITLFLKRWA